MERRGVVPRHRRDVARRHLGLRPRGSHPLRQPPARGDVRRRPGPAPRPDGVRLPRRRGAGPVRRAPDDAAAGGVQPRRRRVQVRVSRRVVAVGARPREPAVRSGRQPRGGPAPAQRLHRPAAGRRRPADEQAPARRGPADRPDRQLGVGCRAGRDHRLGGALRALRPRPELLPRGVRRLPRDRARGRPGPGQRRGAASPLGGRRVRVRGARAGRDRLGVDARTRGRTTRLDRTRRLHVGHPPGRHRCQGRRGRAPGPGHPERPDAGGGDHRQRGPHPRGGARPGPLAGAAARRLGAGPGLPAGRRRRRGGAALRLRRRPERGPCDAGGLGDGARAGPAGAAGAGIGVGREAAHHRVPRDVRGRGPGHHHDHLRSPAVPPRDDPVDGRAGRRPARPGRRARAGRARARRRPRRRYGGVPPEVGVPGDDEPRDPHAAERRHRA